MVAQWQTVEDGGPRQAIDRLLCHEGTEEEFIRVEITVRRPYSLMNFTQRLIIRASMVTGEVTASLEGIRTE
jgi:hypothetical protein